MVVFKDYIIKRLPNYIIANDSYKDGSGKGFVYRFLEIFGEEIDDEIYDKIEGMANQLDPLTVDSNFIEYFAARMGDLPRFLDDDTDFRRVLTFILSIYKIKGTIKSYKSLLTTLGFTDVTVTEIPPSAVLYDSGIIYDDGAIYDDNCVPCSDYDLDITTGLPINGELYQKVLSLVALIEPINANLRTIEWNGTPTEDHLIEVYIDANGDLIYNNPNDPDLVLELVDGDLVISGPNSELYYLENGDLHFILT